MSEMMQWVREDDIPAIADSVLKGNPHAPHHVELHITNQCNSGCYFCNQKFLTGKQEELPIDRFQYLIKYLASIGVRSIRLSGGGEPTTHPQILQIIEYIYSAGLMLSSFDTNGIQLNHQISRHLLAGKLLNLHVSVQAPTPESWEKVTNRDASDFNIVINNIKEFIQMENEKLVNVYLSFIIDQVTYKNLDQVGFLCNQLGVHAIIHDLNCYSYDKYFLENLFCQLHSLEHNDKVSIYFHSNFTNSHTEHNYNLIQDTECYAPWVSTLIKPNGNVYPCCGLQSPQNVLGNTLIDNFTNIWSGKRYKVLRLEAKKLFFQNLESDDEKLNTPSFKFLSDSCVNICAVKLGMFSCPRLSAILNKEES